MQKHQRYFPVTSKSTGDLLPYFITVRWFLHFYILYSWLVISLCSNSAFVVRLLMVLLVKKWSVKAMKLYSGYAKAQWRFSESLFYCANIHFRAKVLASAFFVCKENFRQIYILNWHTNTGQGMRMLSSFIRWIHKRICLNSEASWRAFSFMWVALNFPWILVFCLFLFYLHHIE